MNTSDLTIEEILGNIEKGLDKELEALFGEDRVFPVDDEVDQSEAPVARDVEVPEAESRK